MLPPRACPLLLLLLHCAALRPATLNLGVTARSLVDSYRTYRSDGRVEPLEEFVASAVAAFRCAYSLDVVLMELDLAGEASSEDRTAQGDWLRTVRTTLTTLGALNDDAAMPTDALSERVTTVVAEASENGLQIDRRISAAPVDEETSAVPVDHLVLLTLQAWCNHEGEENEPGAT